MYGGCWFFVGIVRSQVIFSRSHRFSENLQTVALSEGFPSDTPPHRIWSAIILRQQVLLESKRLDALTLFKMGNVFQNGGKYMDVADHLYPKGFGEVLDKKQKEEEELMKSKALLDRFRALAQRDDLEEYRAR